MFILTSQSSSISSTAWKAISCLLLVICQAMWKAASSCLPSSLFFYTKSTHTETWLQPTTKVTTLASPSLVHFFLESLFSLYLSHKLISSINNHEPEQVSIFSLLFEPALSKRLTSFHSWLNRQHLKWKSHFYCNHSKLVDYVEIVKNRKAETLLAIIWDRVAPGTSIVSDNWSSYAKIEEFPGIVHFTVNI